MHWCDYCISILSVSVLYYSPMECYICMCVPFIRLRHPCIPARRQEHGNRKEQ